LSKEYASRGAERERELNSSLSGPLCAHCVCGGEYLGGSTLDFKLTHDLAAAEIDSSLEPLLSLSVSDMSTIFSIERAA
jgi:hypothetical protein